MYRPAAQAVGDFEEKVHKVGTRVGAIGLVVNMLVLMLNNLSSNPADVFFYYFSVKISKKSSRKTRVQVSVATVPKKVEATWTCLKKVKNDLPD